MQSEELFDFAKSDCGGCLHCDKKSTTIDQKLSKKFDLIFCGVFLQPILIKGGGKFALNVMNVAALHAEVLSLSKFQTSIKNF